MIIIYAYCNSARDCWDNGALMAVLSFTSIVKIATIAIRNTPIAAIINIVAFFCIMDG